MKGAQIFAPGSQNTSQHLSITIACSVSLWLAQFLTEGGSESSCRELPAALLVSLPHPGSKWLSAGGPLLRPPSNYNQLSNHLFGVRARRLWLSSRVGEKRAAGESGLVSSFRFSFLFSFLFLPFFSPGLLLLWWWWQWLQLQLQQKEWSKSLMPILVPLAQSLDGLRGLCWGRKTWLVRREVGSIWESKGVNFRSVNSETCYL